MQESRDSHKGGHGGHISLQLSQWLSSMALPVFVSLGEVFLETVQVEKDSILSTMIFPFLCLSVFFIFCMKLDVQNSDFPILGVDMFNSKRKTSLKFVSTRILTDTNVIYYFLVLKNIYLGRDECSNFRYFQEI